MPEFIGTAHRNKGRMPAFTADPHGAAKLIMELFATLAAVRAMLDRIYAPAGLTEHKFVVLTSLAAQSPSPSLATELADAAHVTRASMTKLLDDLGQRGWIERRRGQRDRRVIHIHLTAAGRRVVDSAHAHFANLCRDLAGETRPRELARFNELCGSLRSASHSLSRKTPTFQLPALP